ncbi:MAG: hypothetical protein K0S71_2481 [Clostridia bacterium]|jgi:mannosyltransferase OCH1-like enzyme|nr:hypothetical protein [Clostridia bacterium]
MEEFLIPKIIHRIWVGNKKIPEEFIAYAQTWRKYHPDWEMKLWTDENMIPLKNQAYYDNAKELAKKADIARYELLYQFGGIYIDCDVECLKNIEPLLSGIEAFAGAEDDYYITNAIMGCTVHNPIMKCIIENIPVSIQKNSALEINYQTGPIFITELLKGAPQFKVFEKDTFYPYHWTEKYRKGEKFEKAYAVHHWAASWI